MLLSEDLLALHLSPNEVAEIFDETVAALNSTQLWRSTKISLLWVIFNKADLKYAEVILQCFSEHAGTFNEQEAFSSVAQLTLFVRRARHDEPRLRALLAKNNIVKHLEIFQTNPSPRLRQSAARLIDNLTAF
ncbi:MAG: hypothetical protein JWR69_4071 [Pedosphaera sp.]|nr:hypothetical protein [Pedosphaera sp.]